MLICFKRTALLFLICSLLPAALFSAPYKLGLILPLTGPEKWLGRELRDGAQLSAEDSPSTDRPELIVLDDGGLSSKLERHLTQLNRNRDVLAVIGGGSFGQTKTIDNMANRLEYPVLICGDPLGSSKQKSKVFQLLPTNAQQFAAIFAYLNATIPAALSKKTIAVITQSGQQSELPLQQTAAAVGASVKIVKTASGRLSTSQARDLRRGSTKAVIVVGNNGDSLRACQEVRRASINSPIFGRLRQASDDFEQAAKGRVSDFFAVTAAGHEMFPPCEPTFVKRFFTRFGRKPTSWAALAYDGVQLANKAVKAANNSRSRVGRELASLPMHFGVGFVFDPGSDELWFPSVARLNEEGFITRQPPGKMKPLAEVPVSRNQARRSNRARVNRRQTTKDITQTGRINKWRHFLVLPGR